MSYESKRHEADRLNLLHKIVFKAELEDWEGVNRFRNLYHDIYGPLPYEFQTLVVTGEQ